MNNRRVFLQTFGWQMNERDMACRWSELKHGRAVGSKQ